MSNRSASPEATLAFRRMWSDLETVGLDGETGGYRRFAWTRTDHDLREWFAGETAARGLRPELEMRTGLGDGRRA